MYNTETHGVERRMRKMYSKRHSPQIHPSDILTIPPLSALTSITEMLFFFRKHISSVILIEHSGMLWISTLSKWGTSTKVCSGIKTSPFNTVQSVLWSDERFFRRRRRRLSELSWTRSSAVPFKTYIQCKNAKQEVQSRLTRTASAVCDLYSVLLIQRTYLKYLKTKPTVTWTYLEQDTHLDSTWNCLYCPVIESSSSSLKIIVLDLLDYIIEDQVCIGNLWRPLYLSQMWTSWCRWPS